MNPLKSRWLQFLGLCMMMLSTSLSHSDQIRISTFTHETAQIDVSAKVLEKLYQRLGHQMQLVRFPGKRSLVEANNGSVNGELIRVKATAKVLSNLVRIPTQVDSFKVMALTLKASPKVVGMGGLIGKKIGILRGVELTDRVTKNLSRQVLNDIDGLYKSLLAGRVDVILYPELDAIEYLALNDPTEKIVINVTPVIEVPLYHYIHKDKPVLIKQMSQLLEKLEKSGELDAIIYSAEQARR